MRKKIRGILILIVILVCISEVCYSTEVGKLVAVFGNKKIKELTRKIDLKLGDPIYTGYEIYANIQSSAKIKFNDGKTEITVVVGPGTKLSIPNQVSPLSTVKLLEGSVLSVVRPGTKYNVKTPNAIAGVAGTVFLIRYNKNSGTLLYVFEGKVKFSSIKDIMFLNAKLVSKDENAKIDTDGNYNGPVKVGPAGRKLKDYWYRFIDKAFRRRTLPERITRNLNLEGNVTLIIRVLTDIAKSGLPGYFEVYINGYNSINGKYLSSQTSTIEIENFEPGNYTVTIRKGGTYYTKEISIADGVKFKRISFPYQQRNLAFYVNGEKISPRSENFQLFDSRGEKVKIATFTDSYALHQHNLVCRLDWENNVVLAQIPADGKKHYLKAVYKLNGKVYQKEFAIYKNMPRNPSITLVNSGQR